MKPTRSFAVILGTAIFSLAGCSSDPAVDASASASGNGVCLQTNQIDHTEIVNDKSILFYMKTGKPYLNTMPFSCPSLTMEEGFAYTTDFPEICSNAQTIRVLRSGNFCELGQFTPFEPPKMPPVPAKS